MRSILLIALLGALCGCGRSLSKDDELGITFCIEMYNRSPENIDMPSIISPESDRQLRDWAAGLMNFNNVDMSVTRFGHFIIIHYDNKKFVAENTGWSFRKYGESVVVNVIQKKYVVFNMART